MNLNQPSLYEFERERKANEYIPPEASNSFYNIGEGQLNLHCIRYEPALFDLYIESGKINVGDNTFYVSGDMNDSNRPYRTLTTNPDTELIINKTLSINGGLLEIHGILSLPNNAVLIVNNNSKVTLYPDSTFVVGEKTQILIEQGASVDIYGDVNIKLSSIGSIIQNTGIYLDSAAHLNVEDVDFGNRDYSMTDYEMDLRKKPINPFTQGEYNSDDGRIGYTWKNGDLKNGSQCLELSVLWGQSVLGDFKLSILGTQDKLVNDLQIIESFTVEKGTEFYISESYKGFKYLQPELYVGMIIGNYDKPGWITVDGTVYVDGPNAKITLDRGGTMTIGEEGTVYLKNQGIIRSTYNDDNPVLFINGTLVIDYINQLVGFNANNFVFGDDGKLIILNPDTGNYRLLFETPAGIESSQLYELFKPNIEHIEYHVQNNCGIRIDTYFPYFGRDLNKWYADRRIEKAIYDGLLVWHDGAVIELDSEIIPWVTLKCTLYEASRLFKSFSVDDKVKLKEVTKQLKYAGCGNITFRFIVGHEHNDVIMNLEDIQITEAINKPMSAAYMVETTNNGKLFLSNMVATPSEESIVNDKATTYKLTRGKNEIMINTNK